MTKKVGVVGVVGLGARPSSTGRPDTIRQSHDRPANAPSALPWACAAGP